MVQLEKKQYHLTILLDTTQNSWAFDTVWHSVLVYKLYHVEPAKYCVLLATTFMMGVSMSLIVNHAYPNITYGGCYKSHCHMARKWTPYIWKLPKTSQRKSVIIFIFPHNSHFDQYNFGNTKAICSLYPHKTVCPLSRTISTLLLSTFSHLQAICPPKIVPILERSGSLMAPDWRIGGMEENRPTRCRDFCCRYLWPMRDDIITF